MLRHVACEPATYGGGAAAPSFLSEPSRDIIPGQLTGVGDPRLQRANRAVGNVGSVPITKYKLRTTRRNDQLHLNYSAPRGVPDDREKRKAVTVGLGTTHRTWL